MPNNGNEQLFTEGESPGINFLIMNDLKKRGNEWNTSPTPVNRSLREKRIMDFIFNSSSISLEHKRRSNEIKTNSRYTSR